jgi:hypothetical protein
MRVSAIFDRIAIKRENERKKSPEPVAAAVAEFAKAPRKRIRPNKKFTQLDEAVTDARNMVAMYQQDVIQETTGETIVVQSRVKRERPTEQEPEQTLPMPQVTTAVVPDTTLQIETMRDRLDPKKMFQKFVAEAARTQDDIINRIPKMEDLLPLMNQVEAGEGPTWTRCFVSHAIARGLEIPVFEVITPEYVSDYLRQPDPSKQWERPCKTPFEKCESVCMRGPVLREFMLPSQAKALFQSPYFHSNGTLRTVTLPEKHGYCFLCTQRLIYILWAKQKTKATQKKTELSAVALIHDYIMAVNCPGGYDIRLILPGFTKFIGLGGPVIQHDKLHYAPARFENNLRGWVQKDEMLFRNGAMKSQ